MAMLNQNGGNMEKLNIIGTHITIYYYITRQF